MEKIDLRFISPLVRFSLTGLPIRPVKKTEAKQEEQTINHTKREIGKTVVTEVVSLLHSLGVEGSAWDYLV